MTTLNTPNELHRTEVREESNLNAFGAPQENVSGDDNATQDLSTSSSSGSSTTSLSTSTSKQKYSTDLLRKQLKEEESVFTTSYLLDISTSFDPETSPKDMFTLASLYARSTNETLLRQGEEWLKKLMTGSYNLILGPEYKLDCCFLLAWANFRLREYKESRKYAEKLVQINPLNTQAVELINLIDEEIMKEAKKGVILGGLAIGAATAAFGLIGLATASAVVVAMKKK